MKPKLNFEQVHPLIEHMRVRLNEYQLFIRDDGRYLLDGVPVSDNHIVCILKRDAEAAHVEMPEGRARDFVMRQVLSAWRKRLMTMLDREQMRVKLTYEPTAPMPLELQLPV